MPSDPPVFPEAEFRARIDRLQCAMAAEDIDALLLTMPADIFYVSGFLTRFWESPARPWFVVVPVCGAPKAVIPSIGAAQMGQSWIADIRTWPAPDPTDDGITLLAEAIAEMVPARGTFATPMGLETHIRMPLRDLHRMIDRLAPRRLVDGTAAVQRVREIKSEAEIDKLRSICTITGMAFAELAGQSLQDRPLAAVFAEFQALLLRAGADWVSYVAGAAGPDGYADVIAPAGAAPLAPGDVLMLDAGAVKDGYFSDFDRNFFLGPPKDGVRHVQEALWQATEDALRELRPGMRACDAHRVLAEGLRRWGVRPCAGRLGHGLGITLTEWPSFTPLDTTVLRENMVLTLEPSAHVTEATFLVHEENIVLRADGPELLSPRAPRHGFLVGA
ncbi:MAG: Xaa-Pro peptidase family protein [Pseudomonadota bacterium]